MNTTKKMDQLLGHNGEVRKYFKKKKGRKIRPFMLGIRD